MTLEEAVAVFSVRRLGPTENVDAAYTEEELQAVDVLRAVGRAFPKMLEALESNLHHRGEHNFTPLRFRMERTDPAWDDCHCAECARARDALRAAREAVKP